MLLFLSLEPLKVNIYGGTFTNKRSSIRGDKIAIYLAAIILLVGYEFLHPSLVHLHNNAFVVVVVNCRANKHYKVINLDIIVYNISDDKNSCCLRKSKASTVGGQIGDGSKLYGDKLHQMGTSPVRFTVDYTCRCYIWNL